MLVCEQQMIETVEAGCKRGPTLILLLYFLPSGAWYICTPCPQFKTCHSDYGVYKLSTKNAATVRNGYKQIGSDQMTGRGMQPRPQQYRAEDADVQQRFVVTLLAPHASWHSLFATQHTYKKDKIKGFFSM